MGCLMGLFSWTTGPSTLLPFILKCFWVCMCVSSK